MGKPTICICENKGADQLRSNREADQRLCFRYSDSTVPLLLNPKFQASSSFLRLYRSVCVEPGRKPHCWFSHEAAHIFYKAILMCTHNQCLRAKKKSNILKFFNFYNLGKICSIKILSNAQAFIQNNTFTIEGDGRLNITKTCACNKQRFFKL